MAAAPLTMLAVVRADLYMFRQQDRLPDLERQIPLRPMVELGSIGAAVVVEAVSFLRMGQVH